MRSLKEWTHHQNSGKQPCIFTLYSTPYLPGQSFGCTRLHWSFLFEHLPCYLGNKRTSPIAVMSPRSGEASLKMVRSILSVAHSTTPRSFVSSSSRSLCIECRVKSLESSSSSSNRSGQLQQLNRRHFSGASQLSKKSSASSKSARKSLDVGPPQKNVHIPDNAATKERDAEIDPYDFHELNEGIATAHARLKDALLKTRDAGRVTPQMLESLQVEFNVKGRETHGGKPHHEKLKLGDMASVVQKGGRMLQVYCAEEAVRFCLFRPSHLFTYVD